MNLGLAGRVFIVTAASSGLGLASAEALVDEGARVVLVARREARLDEAVAALGANSADRLVADLVDPEAPAAAIALARQRWGRLDGGLLSAGGPPAGTALGTTEEQWRAAFDGVFLPTLRATRAIAEAATGVGPAIAWVLSTSVKSPIQGLAASNGLRPGLAMLVKQFADELGPLGIRVLALLPGRLATARVEHLDSLTGDAAAARARAEAAIPLRRYGDPAEFGRVAAFLLSPAASYLTGSVVPVDGGALRAL